MLKIRHDNHRKFGAALTRYPLSVVLRLQRVQLSQAALEKELGITLDRYEESDSQGAYAQIDIPDDDEPWIVALHRLNLIADGLKAMRSRGAVGCASLDVAVAFNDSVLSKSVIVPAALMKVMSEANIDLDVSIYRTSD